jgi:hypothetical protein
LRVYLNVPFPGARGTTCMIGFHCGRLSLLSKIQVSD